jgi:hypothetical protein
MASDLKDFLSMLGSELSGEDLFGIPGHMPREMELVSLPVEMAFGFCDAKPPLPSLVIEPFGRFNPRDDMTPVEAAHLAVMLAHGVLHTPHDYQGYVRLHGLQRHFGSLSRD